MIDDMVVPLTVATALAVAVAAGHRRLPPALAARTITVALAVIAAAAIPTVWITALGYVSHAPIAGRWLGRCAEALGSHEHIGPVAGIPALALTVFGVWRAGRSVRNYLQLRTHGDGGLHLTEHPDVFAFTVPGRAGRIVMSSAMHDMLDPDERCIVLAHERAHARHRHDRYLLTGQLAADLLMPLRPIVQQLQFSLERWADEAAVRECGDRRFVARTLGRVALSAAEMQPAMAFAGLGVSARVAALLRAPVAPPSLMARVGLYTLVAGASVFAAFQLRHLGEMLLDLCPG